MAPDDVEMHSDDQEHLLIVVNSIGGSFGVSGTIGYRNIISFRGASCQFHHIIVPAVFIPFGEIFVRRVLAVIGKHGSRNAVPVLIAIQAHVDKGRESRLNVVDAIYDQKIIIGGQLEVFRFDIHGISVIHSDVHILQDALVVIQYCEVKVQIDGVVFGLLYLQRI
ncbi:MAG: hypothetical protein ACOYIR_04845 [Christensenellales bacterium]